MFYVVCTTNIEQGDHIWRDSQVRDKSLLHVFRHCREYHNGIWVV